MWVRAWCCRRTACTLLSRQHTRDKARTTRRMGCVHGSQASSYPACVHDTAVPLTACCCRYDCPTCVCPHVHSLVPRSHRLLLSLSHALYALPMSMHTLEAAPHLQELEDEVCCCVADEVRHVEAPRQGAPERVPRVPCDTQQTRTPRHPDGHTLAVAQHTHMPAVTAPATKHATAFQPGSTWPSSQLGVRHQS